MPVAEDRESSRRRRSRRVSDLTCGPRLTWPGRTASFGRTASPSAVAAASLRLEARFLPDTPTRSAPGVWENQLLWGDNQVLLSALANTYAGQVDLVYIDPPFATGGNFSAQVQVGKAAGAQSVRLGGDDGDERLAYRDRWSGGLAAYLEMLGETFALLHTLLSPKGSLIVHLDHHSGHYAKVLLDEIFGCGGKSGSRDLPGFRNDIAWCYGGGGAARNHYPHKHDMLLWYSKGSTWTFNRQFRPYSPGTLQRGLTAVKGADYQLDARGAGLSDYWADESVQKILSPTAYENLKYPTQKPMGLLRRIVLGHSNPGDLLLDAFAGSGTSLAAAASLGRRWIGCDLSPHAIKTIVPRMLETFCKGGDAAPEGEMLPFGLWRVEGESPAALSQLTMVLEAKGEQTWQLVLCGFTYAGTGNLPQAVRDQIKHWADAIDHWSLDTDYDGKVFVGRWHATRKRPGRALALAAPIPAVTNRAGRRLCVRVVDVIGQVSWHELLLVDRHDHSRQNQSEDHDACTHP